MSNDLSFFTEPGVMTDPGRYAELLDTLPRDIPSLCSAVQGLMIHVFWAERYGVTLPAERKAEVQLRSVREKLERILRLDPAPLTVKRQPERRLVGNCRDFSLMLTAILRRQGVPARARCGFGRYFIPGHYEDHWACEYWNAAENRWVLVDAQLDELQRGVLGIQFDPADVPRGRFVTGGKAWRLCRSGEADPDTFGIFEMKGLWFVRGDFVRDVASINGMELLPWDSWGLADLPDDRLTADDISLLDRTAVLAEDDVPDFASLRRLYLEEPRLSVPPVITSYVDGRPLEVPL